MLIPLHSWSAKYIGHYVSKMCHTYYVSVLKTFGAVANEQCITKNFPAAGLELVGLVTSGVGISTPQWTTRHWPIIRVKPIMNMIVNDNNHE